ncbi:MAG: KAP family NTPase [Micrococcales bacterium]|nr:KAP family NTPase [Micrococcales bacterium]
MARWATISNDSPTVIDALDRGALVDRIVGLVEEVQAPFTLGVYGGWGSGKSSIMKRVRWRLDPPRDGRPLAGPPRGAPVSEPAGEDDLRWRRTVWFNAWEHQNDTDPAVALLQEARRMLRPSLWNRWRMRKWFRILRDAIGPALEKAGQPVAAVGGPLTAWRQSVERVNRDLFAVQEDQVRKREAFTEIVNLLAKRADRGKIIIFIDDLDRCDDDKVARRLLDDIKTYLDHSRCVFVVGVNSAKLRAQRDDAQDDGSQGAGHRGESLGEDRLNKIINYPFYVPPLEKEQYGHFVVRMLKECFGWESGNAGGDSTKPPPDHRLDVPQIQKVADILKEILAARSASVRETVRLCNVFIVNHELTSSSFGETGLWGDYRPEAVAVLSAVQAFYPEAHEWLCSEQDWPADKAETSAAEGKLRWLFGSTSTPVEALRGGMSLRGTKVLDQARRVVKLPEGRERLPLYLSMWGHPHQSFDRHNSRWNHEYRARQDMDLVQTLEWIRSPQGRVAGKSAWETGDLRVVKLGKHWWWVVTDDERLKQEIEDLRKERSGLDGENEGDRERMSGIDRAIAAREEALASFEGEVPRALLLSEGMVDAMQYDSEAHSFSEWRDAKPGAELKGALWRDSTLRHWLRTDFADDHLPADVRDAVLTVTTTTETDWAGPEKFQNWDEKAKNEQRGEALAKDKRDDETIFLLKWEEVFPEGSPFVLGEVDVDARGPDGAVSFWWLRSPGSYPIYALGVLPSSLAGPDLRRSLFWAGGWAGVRPAFWLNLES